MKIFNLNGDEWDGTRDREGWRAKGVLVGQRIGGELIGATMSEIEPGSKLWPYHTHYLNEEWMIVLRGEPTLRTPDGEQVLKEGDVACFPRGKRGAHQVINRTDSRVRVLMLSSMVSGEIIEYLDTGKVLAKDVEDEDIMFARPGPRSSTGKTRTRPAPTVTLEELDRWLDGRTSTRSPAATPKTRSTTGGPWAEPLRGHGEIRAATERAIATQEDIEFGHEALAITPDGRGIARWWVSIKLKGEDTIEENFEAEEPSSEHGHLPRHARREPPVHRVPRVVQQPHAPGLGSAPWLPTRPRPGGNQQAAGSRWPPSAKAPAARGRA